MWAHSLMYTHIYIPLRQATMTGAMTNDPLQPKCLFLTQRIESYVDSDMLYIFNMSHHAFPLIFRKAMNDP